MWDISRMEKRTQQPHSWGRLFSLPVKRRLRYILTYNLFWNVRNGNMSSLIAYLVSGTHCHRMFLIANGTDDFEGVIRQIHGSVVYSWLWDILAGWNLCPQKMVIPRSYTVHLLILTFSQVHFDFWIGIDVHKCTQLCMVMGTWSELLNCPDL